MKKLLILAYDFPPYVSVGGLRPYNWYRYLKTFGVEPIVITRQWSNTYGNHLDYIAPGSSETLFIEETEYGTIIRTPYKPNLSNRLLLKYGDRKYKWLRKAISAYYEFAQFLFPVGPKVEIYRAAKDYLKQNKVDAIIASGDPFILFKYAAKLGSVHQIPWIADYRDPWSHNQEYAKSALQNRWHRFFEKRIVKKTSHITTVSNFVFNKIDGLIPGKPHSILPNGYDPEVIDKIAEIPQGHDTLQIAFVGTIYEWHPIESFLRTVKVFIEQNQNVTIRINFYGTNISEKLQELTTYEYPELAKFVTITPKIPNLELLRKLAENNVMLLFNYYSYMGTKIFDYLGIRRKMILCYSNDPEAQSLKDKYYNIEESASESNQLQADLIQETQSGIVVKDSAHLLEVLNELYQEFKSSGEIACHSIGVENYSRKIQVEQLAELVHKMEKV
jgi:glycosyltransferase involved in cell wall biosynthesis